MKLLRSTDNLPSDVLSGAVSIGNFDGVHQGHARIVTKLREMADQVKGPAVILTFDPHPVRLLRPDQAPPPLTWTDRKAELLAELGVDMVIAYPTDEALLQLSPGEFFSTIVRKQLDARAMVEGPNFYFGQNRTGNIETLRHFCMQAGIGLEVVAPLLLDGEYVSSSRVRKMIELGDVAGARRMLTQPYRIRGMVTHGAARGSRIGFPTANVDAIDTLRPGCGVYAGHASVADQTYPAAINIGANPTFGENSVKVEAHLLNFNGNVYGQSITVDFLERLRDIQPFATVHQLKHQLAQDVAKTERISAQSRPGTESRISTESPSTAVPRIPDTR